MLRTLNEQIAVCEKKLAQLAAQDPQVQRLMTVPSVGLITAVCAVAILGDPRRFSDAHKVASYLGLVPRENSSGGRVHKGRLTKTGNRMMRRLLVQCAHGVMQRRTADTAHLWQWAEAITARKKKGTAAVALARRLGGILWAMLRDERPYTPKPRHSEIDAAQVATPADTPRRKRSRTTSTRTPVRHGPSQTAQPGA
jgi:error-prone DNA polymerase